MKKKLILSLCLKTLIFIIAGVFIMINLNVITSRHEMKEHQEKIISRYDNILYNLKGAQAELYRHQAGYSRDINSLVDYVLQIEEGLALTASDYSGHISDMSCNSCHGAKGKVETLNKMVHGTRVLLAGYREKISRLITMRDFEHSRPLDIEAVKDGDRIIETMNTIRHAALKMNESMEETLVDSVRRATYSIATAIIVSLLLSVLIVYVTIQSVTGPVKLLVSGIENVSSGKYDSKVAVSSDDEIGFLARTFNEMTDSLNAISRQKEALMKELQDLNAGLENRVKDATEELRIAHENMLRSETLSAVGTFASGVAHELATPLSSIISYFQMIKGKMPEHFAEDADLIEGELLRCRGILRDMLKFARLPEKDRTMTDVNSIIRDLLNLVKYQTEYRKVRITEKLAPGLPAVMAVSGQLRQVFINLIVNALQAIEGDGEISVETSESEDKEKIFISVSDSGSGITGDEVGRIFQPFYTTKKSGTGLGLSISYGIIKAHGGDIEIKSGSGKGTTFTVTLPT
ncbi:MAG: HAMP domain-containing protein [Nitrospirae bacterium]|nr:HAMP domain-containing protein [Nitrospirota bacterium]